MRLLLYCQACDHEFSFHHPAVTSLDKLARVSINCPNCKTRIMQDFSAMVRVSMIPVKKVVGH
jgi:DNA-directed RNA polymerase subunit RPC12/RpoP